MTDADTQTKKTERIGATEAAATLGLTTARIRQIAREGRYGATKIGRAWTFDADLIHQQATRTRPSSTAPSSEPDWERDLLIAENASLVRRLEEGDLRTQIASLQAALTQRDQTIAVLQTRVNELSANLRAAHEAINALGQPYRNDQ